MLPEDHERLNVSAQITRWTLMANDAREALVRNRVSELREHTRQVPGLITGLATVTGERDRLQAWKDDAVKVIASWEEAWQALPKNVREDATTLGQRKSEIVAAYIRLTEGSK